MELGLEGWGLVYDLQQRALTVGFWILYNRKHTEYQTKTSFEKPQTQAALHPHIRKPRP